LSGIRGDARGERRGRGGDAGLPRTRVGLVDLPVDFGGGGVPRGVISRADASTS
jgi:hypothetical protein